MLRGFCRMVIRLTAYQSERPWPAYLGLRTRSMCTERWGIAFGAPMSACWTPAQVCAWGQGRPRYIAAKAKKKKKKKGNQKEDVYALREFDNSPWEVNENGLKLRLEDGWKAFQSAIGSPGANLDLIERMVPLKDEMESRSISSGKHGGGALPKKASKSLKMVKGKIQGLYARIENAWEAQDSCAIQGGRYSRYECDDDGFPYAYHDYSQDGEVYQEDEEEEESDEEESIIAIEQEQQELLLDLAAGQKGYEAQQQQQQVESPDGCVARATAESLASLARDAPDAISILACPVSRCTDPDGGADGGAYEPKTMLFLCGAQCLGSSTVLEVHLPSVLGRASEEELRMREWLASLLSNSKIQKVTFKGDTLNAVLLSCVGVPAEPLTDLRESAVGTVMAFAPELPAPFTPARPRLHEVLVAVSRHEAIAEPGRPKTKQWHSLAANTADAWERGGQHSDVPSELISNICAALWPAERVLQQMRAHSEKAHRIPQQALLALQSLAGSAYADSDSAAYADAVVSALGGEEIRFDGSGNAVLASAAEGNTIGTVSGAHAHAPKGIVDAAADILEVLALLQILPRATREHIALRMGWPSISAMVAGYRAAEAGIAAARVNESTGGTERKESGLRTPRPLARTPIEILIDDGLPSVLRYDDGSEEPLPVTVRASHVVNGLQRLKAHEASVPVSACPVVQMLPLLPLKTINCSCIGGQPLADDMSFQSVPPCDGSGVFNAVGRAGVLRTLHRVSRIRDGSGIVRGLTLRIGRHMPGVAWPLTDVLARSARRASQSAGAGASAGAAAFPSLLLIGGPGSGKTTLLRDMAAQLSTRFAMGRRVVIVDSSNEIAGDGQVPHRAIGEARRMMVPAASTQSKVLLEALTNHNPDVIMVDELARQEEIDAASSICQRGVGLLATVHAASLASLLTHPKLKVLLGDVKEVTLGDASAKRLAAERGVNGFSKTQQERCGPPLFQSAVEIVGPSAWRVHWDVARSVDSLLRGRKPTTELKVRHGGRLLAAMEQGDGPGNLSHGRLPKE